MSFYSIYKACIHKKKWSIPQTGDMVARCFRSTRDRARKLRIWLLAITANRVARSDKINGTSWHLIKKDCRMSTVGQKTRNRSNPCYPHTTFDQGVSVMPTGDAVLPPTPSVVPGFLGRLLHARATRNIWGLISSKILKNNSKTLTNLYWIIWTGGFRFCCFLLGRFLR